MTTTPQRLMPDCSALVKWEIASEAHAAEAGELLISAWIKNPLWAGGI